MTNPIVDELTAEYNKGYNAGRAKTQADDDYNFWLRQYAGQAMQGLLAGEKYIDAEGLPDIDIMRDLPKEAVNHAKALLKELEE